MADISSALRSTIPISLFNRGMAGKVFEDVRRQGAKVVMKNNSPECVLLSPEEYLRLIAEVNDAKLAALAAQRMQGVNKQILKIDGVPVLVRSIRALAAIPEIREMVMVARPELFEQREGWKQEYRLPDFCLTAGGDTRQQSVLNRVGSLSEQIE